MLWLRKSTSTVIPLGTALDSTDGDTEEGALSIANTDIMFWWSVQVAKGTPKPILDQLETWFNKVVELDDTKKFLEQFGQAPFPGNPQMLKAALTKEVRDWAAYTKLAKVEPQ